MCRASLVMGYCEMCEIMLVLSENEPYLKRYLAQTMQ